MNTWIAVLYTGTARIIECRVVGSWLGETPVRLDTVLVYTVETTDETGALIGTYYIVGYLYLGARL